jgi:UPF0755 protein
LGKSSKSKRKIVGWSLVLLMAALLLAGWVIYSWVFIPNLRLSANESPYLFVPTGSTFEDVVRILDNRKLLDDEKSFRWLSEKMKYTNAARPGRYLLKAGMSNKDLVGLLRSGRQVPVRLTFNNIRLKEELAASIGSQIEAPAQSVLNLLNDEDYVSSLGFTTETILCMFIPDTYEFYWNTSADQFIQRMKKEYDKFWNGTRNTKAHAMEFTPVQVSILASIVQKETNANDEKRTIAGVYINRMKKGWKLEADPTLVYALGDFTVNRVLAAFKKIVSPYNTYMFEGLPPGPICLPEISSLDAVLNYTKHDYMYFCAKDDFSGRHSFAVTYAQHKANARRFQQALDRRGIKS